MVWRAEFLCIGYGQTSQILIALSSFQLSSNQEHAYFTQTLGWTWQTLQRMKTNALNFCIGVEGSLCVKMTGQDVSIRIEI